MSSITTGFDDGTGYAVQNAGASVGTDEENLANLGNLPATSAIKRRQANKIGAGISSITTGFDDGTGYAVQNAGASIDATEESLANIGNLPTTSDVGRRQFANTGFGAEALLDGVDTGAGQGSQDALTNAGNLVAADGVAAGGLVPARRQLANTGYGAEALLDGVDTGVGQGSQDALTNAGTLIATDGVAAGQMVPSKM